MLFLAVVLLGFISFQRLPIDLLPDVAYPRLVVHTTEGGSAPAEMERFVSEPIEQAVATVPGVREVESISREGLSLVTIRFAWGTDMEFAALGVREKLDGLGGRLPERASRPAVLRLDPRSEPVMSLSVSGGGDLARLKELSEQVFRRRLEQIDGVAQAAVTGGPEREIQVEVDPERLDALGLTLDDVSTALSGANASAPGGSLRQGRYRYALRTLGELRTVQEISAVPLRSRGAASGLGGNPLPRTGLRLADVATVTDGWRERESVTRFDGAEAVGVLVFKDAASNTVRVARRVEATLDELREQYPGVRIEVATSQAGFVSDAIDNVIGNLVQGAALAFLVLLFFLRDPRYPVAIALAIPISVIATFSLMDAFGVSLNIMSLGGLALGVGMLVDNSIVVLENTFRHQEAGLDPGAAARAGAEEVQGAITAATLTTIAVFGPIVYIEGVAGELFGALSFTVAFSLLASLFVALTLLPTLAARWGSGGPPRTARVISRPLEAFDRGFRRFAARYETVLARALEHRGRVMFLTGTTLLVGVVLALSLDRRVLPVMDQGEIRARLELPRGTPLERTEETARGLEEVFRADPAVAAVFSSIGRRVAVAGVEEEESGLNTAVLEVRLHSGERTERVLERLLPRLGGLPPGALSVEAGGATAIGRMMGGGAADLAVRLRAEDLEGAIAYGRALEERLAALPTLTNVRLGTEMGQPEMRVEIDRERAASYGIDPTRIAATVQGYMYGRVATELADFDRRVPVVVRLPEVERRSLETMYALRVDGVPIRELVEVSSTYSPAEIRRVGQARVVSVYADVAGGGSLAAAVGAAELLVRDSPPPAGIRAEVGGENEEMRRSFRELGFAFGLALLLVYMILAAKFESFLHPFIILFSIPLGLVGAFLALWLSGGGLNTMSLIGIVVMAGIANNDAVVKVDFINQMRARGMALREAVLAAGHARLRPILMTSATTMLGLLPMALAGGRGAELRSPLAVAIFGGLLSATALTLIVIPVLYELVEEARVWVRERIFGSSGDTRALAAESSPVPGD